MPAKPPQNWPPQPPTGGFAAIVGDVTTTRPPATSTVSTAAPAMTRITLFVLFIDTSCQSWSIDCDSCRGPGSVALSYTPRRADRQRETTLWQRGGAVRRIEERCPEFTRSCRAI